VISLDFSFSFSTCGDRTILKIDTYDPLITGMLEKCAGYDLDHDAWVIRPNINVDKLKEMMGLSYNTIVNLSLMDYIKKQKDEK